MYSKMQSNIKTVDKFTKYFYHVNEDNFNYTIDLTTLHICPGDELEIIANAKNVKVNLKSDELSWLKFSNKKFCTSFNIIEPCVINFECYQNFDFSDCLEFKTLNNNTDLEFENYIKADFSNDPMSCIQLNETHFNFPYPYKLSFKYDKEIIFKDHVTDTFTKSEFNEFFEKLSEFHKKLNQIE